MARALVVLCAATAVVSPAQTFTTLGHVDFVPEDRLVQGFDGNFYGSTWAWSGGTVFKITPAGKPTTLYSFCLQAGCSDGVGPSPLIEATDGNFYGTTEYGGDSRLCSGYGCGTVFKITPGGKLTTLYSFCAQPNCTDGLRPDGGLVQGIDGNFYGTTQFASDSDNGNGTVFKITPSGMLTTLHSFNGADGARPFGLVQATNGNFYGTTGNGGAYGWGSVFKITPGGALTTLHSFCPSYQYDCPDGAGPRALIQATDGNFYGITAEGGAYYSGTVFKITPGGTFTLLYTFCAQSGCPDAGGPTALIQATDGNFYGTTGGYWEGPGCIGLGCGTIFKITPAGTLTTLHTFGTGPGGVGPRDLMQSTSGTFYGAAWNYGEEFFSLCVGLGWFVETLPTTGTVGATINILGTNFTGASSVTFDGTPAPFTIISRTQIQTTVPSGATTGSVKVTIPSGTPTSNKRFRVLPQMTSFSPTSGPVGTVVTITGVSLAQTTRVGIGGVSASFTVVDDTTVTATVPTGATTGKKVVITTRGGNVASATTFTVTE